MFFSKEIVPESSLLYHNNKKLNLDAKYFQGLNNLTLNIKPIFNSKQLKKLNIKNEKSTLNYVTRYGNEIALKYLNEYSIRGLSFLHNEIKNSFSKESYKEYITEEFYNEEEYENFFHFLYDITNHTIISWILLSFLHFHTRSKNLLKAYKYNRFYKRIEKEMEVTVKEYESSIRSLWLYLFIWDYKEVKDFFNEGSPKKQGNPFLYFIVWNMFNYWYSIGSYIIDLSYSPKLRKLKNKITLTFDENSLDVIQFLNYINKKDKPITGSISWI